jgi:hypothetical protein
MIVWTSAAPNWVRGLGVLAFIWLGTSTISPAADDAASFAADGWIARCDTTACKASLASESHQEALLLGRWAGSSGISIGIATPRNIADRDRLVDVRVDDKALLTLHPEHDYRPLERVESFWLTDAQAANTVLHAMSKGKHLRISYLDMIGAPHDADFALDALAKAVAFMDQQQRRPAGAHEGVAPPQSVAAAPDMSRIDLIIRMGIPERLMIRHAHASDCEDPNSPRLKTIAPVIGSLSRVAILYAIPCLMSGAEISYRLWVIETGEIGGITALYFALYDPTFGWRGSDLLYNVAFDATSAKLTSSLRTSQTGGCGHRASWHWKGYAFALDDFQLSPDCAAKHTAKIYPPN